jgi:hypothetical protein
MVARMPPPEADESAFVVAVVRQPLRTCRAALQSGAFFVRVGVKA